MSDITDKNEKFYPENHVPAIPLRKPVKEEPIFCDTKIDFETAANKIAVGTGPIAVDTERASGYKYFPKAYLIQIQRENSGSFLIDPIKEPEQLTPLVKALNGPEWVLHAADQDIPSLYELGFKCKKLFDTGLGGRLLNLPRVNLSFMVDLLLGLKLEKGFGGENWSTRPLPAEWLNYAALDVEVLVELRNEVEKLLIAQNKLEIALAEFQYKKNNPPPNYPVNPKRWRKLKGIGNLTTKLSLNLAKNLWEARNEIAEKNDISPHLVLKDSQIIEIAKLITPNFPQEKIKEILKLQLKDEKNLTQLYSSTMTALQHSENNISLKITETSEPHIPSARKWGKQKPEALKRLNKVKSLLNQISNRINIPVENILLPKTVRELCWNKLTSPIELTTILEKNHTRDWQINLVKEELIRLLIG